MTLRRILLTLGALALVAVYFNQFVLTDLILARGDTFSYFYPYWTARDAAFLRGALPLWSPDVFMGVPLLANPQVGTLYPPNWLTVPLDAPDAIRISVLLHITWALLGAYLLARRTLELDPVSSLVAGVLYALGGYVGGHVEQINQLQGLAWMPWAFLTFALAWHKRLRYVWLFGLVMALQTLAGHTQIVFITGVGLLIYAAADVLADVRAASFFTGEDWRVTLGRRFARGVWVLAAGGGLALALAAAQLIPTLELIGLSNREGGFSIQQALAFSWNPSLAGRSLLPSYDAQVFSEYVAYVGVIGLGLGLVGMFSREMGKRRLIWVLVAGLALALALGAYNPVNWTIASLPGFNLFRVPARWLALVALALAMLGGMGAHMLISQRRYEGELGSLGAISAIIGLLALSSLMSGGFQADIDGSPVPQLITWLAWSAAFVGFVNLVVIRQFADPRLIAVAILLTVNVELWLASAMLPYNDLAPRSAYDDPRLTVRQLQALADADDAPVSGRVLSVSSLVFDPWDKDGITRRAAAQGLTERGLRHTLTAAKLVEVVSPNQSLIWGVPSVDGFDGGVLPTGAYTQFSALLLPEGAPLAVDGRLRERLALPACRGVCLPDQRWLNLTNTAYLVTDKVYDLSLDGVRYDTALARLLTPGEPVVYHPRESFVADTVALLVAGDAPPALRLTDPAPGDVSASALEDGTAQLVMYRLPAPRTVERVTLIADEPRELIAVTLVDSRTGDFIAAFPQGWRMILSSDIKLYENQQAFPRAFVVGTARPVADSPAGTSEALTLMRDPAFDPAQRVVIAGLPAGMVGGAVSGTATITAYEPTRVEVAVSTDAEGYLILTDAYYPGWRAAVNGAPAPVYRANVMFRAVYVPPGDSRVVLEYAPGWLMPGLAISGAAWMMALAAVWWFFVARRAQP